MTSRSDEHERTLAFAEVALGQIKALRHPATPRHYEIWYTYAQNSNRAFNRDIDTIVAAGSPLAESDLILKGIWLTIVLSASAIVLGCTLAVLLVALRTLAGRWAGIAVDAYVELMRNTPFLVQLFMIFFGLPQIGIAGVPPQAARELAPGLEVVAAGQLHAGAAHPVLRDAPAVQEQVVVGAAGEGAR